MESVVCGGSEKEMDGKRKKSRVHCVCVWVERKRENSVHRNIERAGCVCVCSVYTLHTPISTCYFFHS